MGRHLCLDEKGINTTIVYRKQLPTVSADMAAPYKNEIMVHLAAADTARLHAAAVSGK